MGLNVETLEIQIKATNKDLKSVVNSAKRELAGLDAQGDVAITADISGVESAISEVQGKVENLEGGDIVIDGDIDPAETEMQTAEDMAADLDGGDIVIDGDIDPAETEMQTAEDRAANLQGGSLTLTADNTDAMEKMEAVESKALGIRQIMQGAGLLAFGKKAADFAMASIDAASNKIDGVETKINLLLRDNMAAQDEIYRYAASMYENYGLNQTGVLDVASNFVSAFKDSYGEEQAVEMAERLSSAAYDYAYAIGKTPGEVADIFLSMLRGRGQAAKELGILDLTTEKIEETVAALDKAGADLPAGWEKMADEQKKFYAGMLLIEEIGKNTGYSGYLEANENTYAIQNERLAGEWLTLQENVGTILLPLSTNIKSVTSDILHSVNEFTDGMNKSTFARDVNGYFGTMELNTMDVDAIVSNITEPAAKINTAVEKLQGDLINARTKLQGAYSDFEKALFMQEAGTGSADDTVAAAQKMGESAVAANEAKARSLGAIFAKFVDPEDPAWETAIDIGLDAIDAYYDALNAKVNARTEELTAALKDGNTDLARELARQQMEDAYEQSKYAIMAKEELALDRQLASTDWENNGNLSAESVERLLSAAKEGSAEERQKLEAAKEDLLLGMLEALYAQADQEGWDTATTDAKAAEIKNSINAGYNADIAEMDARMQAHVRDTLWNDVMRGQVVAAMGDAGKIFGQFYADGLDQGEYGWKGQFQEETAREAESAFLDRLGPIFSAWEDTPGMLEGMTDEMQRAYDIYSRLAGETGQEGWASDPDVYFGWIEDVLVKGLNIEDADKIHLGGESVENAAADIKEAAGTLAGAIAALPKSIGVNFQVGSYRLGQVINKSVGAYDALQ